MIGISEHTMTSLEKICLKQSQMNMNTFARVMNLEFGMKEVII